MLERFISSRSIIAASVSHVGSWSKYRSDRVIHALMSSSAVVLYAYCKCMLPECISLRRRTLRGMNLWQYDSPSVTPGTVYTGFRARRT